MTEELHRPHMHAEHAGKARHWSGYLGCDNYEAIAERVKRIAAPGRTLIRTHQDGLRPPEVKAGLTFYENSEAWAKGFTKWEREHGCGFSVMLGPGLHGFGASTDYRYDVDKDERVPTTGEEVMRRAEEGGKGWASGWAWIDIRGGLEGDGRNSTEDLITIVEQNEHGYRETVQVIPGDMAFQQKWERDALAAEKLATVLTAPASKVDEYHPAHGIELQARLEAGNALLYIAGNLRKWRESLPGDETYPAVDGRWL